MLGVSTFRRCTVKPKDGKPGKHVTKKASASEGNALAKPSPKKTLAGGGEASPSMPDKKTEKTPLRPFYVELTLTASGNIHVDAKDVNDARHIVEHLTPTIDLDYDVDGSFDPFVTITVDGVIDEDEENSDAG
jgi:hypothetical protein